MPSSLFEPLNVGKLQLKHRLVFPPLTRNRSPGNIPSDLVPTYYGQRSARPGTLLVSEATLITKQAGYQPFVPGIWSRDQIESWKKVTKAVHNNNSFLFIQLWAQGANTDPASNKEYGVDYVAPSAFSRLTKDHGVTPRALTTDEVKQYVKDFAIAGKNAIDAGADGVEIHGANGYLIDQFLHEDLNRRTDQYGGSIENRARFALEVVDALTEAIGAERVGIRLSPFGEFGAVSADEGTIPQWSYVAAELERRAKAGKKLAYISLMEPRAFDPTPITAYSEYRKLAHVQDFFNEIWTGPIIRCGNLVKLAKEIADKQPNTLVAVGRYWISNPDLPDRVEKDLDLAPYDRDTFYTTDAEGYTTYKTYNE